MLSVAILAGGLATRMRPLTEKIPKALIEVAGKPFIFHQIDYLKQQGIQKIVLCVGYLGKIIEAKVGNGSAWNLHITYSFDGDTLRGTGGALQHALPLLEEQFFVLYGDSFLPINYQSVEEAYRRSKKDALMTIMQNQDRWDKSNILFQNNNLIAYNKKSPHRDMNHIDYGLGVISNKIFSDYSKLERFDLGDFYSHLASKNRLAGYEVYKRFYEIGSFCGLQETHEYFTQQDSSISITPEDTGFFVT